MAVKNYNPSTTENVLKNVVESYRTNENGMPHSVGVSATTTPYNTSGSKAGMPSYAANYASNKGYTTPNYAPLKSVQSASGSGNGSGNGSGSGSVSGSGSSSSGGDGAYGAYMQLAAAQMAANQARAEQALAAQREAAQNAYNRGMSYLNSAYDTQRNALGSNYDTTVGQLRDSYNRSNTNVNNDADRSLRQAYINKMINEKNLGQQMTAQGLSGGASESTLARLLNNYGNSRNNIENTRANNLSDLEQTLNSNQAAALQTYNNALSDLDARRMQYAMNLENALANNEVSAMQDYQGALSSNNNAYMNALGNALDQMNRYNFTPSEVTNDIALANVIQNAYDNSSNYNKILNNAAQENGVSTSTLEQNPNNNYLAALLRGLYNA